MGGQLLAARGPAEIRARLWAFYAACAAADMPETMRLATTIETWWPRLLVFLQFGVTNARTELAADVITVFFSQQLFTDSVRDFYAYLHQVLSRYDLVGEEYPSSHGIGVVLTTAGWPDRWCCAPPPPLPLPACRCRPLPRSGGRSGRRSR